MNEQKRNSFFLWSKGLHLLRKWFVRKGSKWTSIDYNREQCIRKRRRKRIRGDWPHIIKRIQCLRVSHTVVWIHSASINLKFLNLKQKFGISCGLLTTFLQCFLLQIFIIFCELRSSVQCQNSQPCFYRSNLCSKLIRTPS